MEKECTKTISCRLQFIDSARLMARSLPNFVNNLAEGIHKIKCKSEHDNKKCERVELNTKVATAFLNTQTLKMI